MTWPLPLISTPVTIGTGGGPITANEPAGAQDEDILVAFVSFRGGVAFGTPTGWDKRFEELGTGTSTGPALAIYTIERGASAPDLTWTRTGGSAATATVYAYRPTAAVSFIAAASGGTSSSTTTHSIAGLTTTDPGTLIIGAATHATSGTNISDWDATDPGAGSGSTVDTTNAPSNGQWRLRGNTANSTGASHRQIIVDALRETAGATGNLVYTSNANTTVKMGAIALYMPTGGSGDTIGVDEIEEYTVYEGSAGDAVVAISGSHTGATDDIQVQIEDLASTVIVAWSTLESGVVAGAFSGTVTVPRGGWYLARVRKANDTAVDDIQAQRWGVGVILGGFGQSHLRDWAADGTGASNNRAVVHNGTAFALMGTTGAGRCETADYLIAALDCPVCIITSAVGGTAISYWWSSGKTANYDAWESKVTAAGGALSAFVLWQGDANVGTSEATYKAEIDAVFAQLRTDYGSGLPVIIGELGRKGGGASDSGWEAIRDAHVAAGNDSGNFSFTTIDLEQEADQQHFTDAGLVAAGARMAQCLLHGIGEASYSRGPVIASATYSGAVVTVTLTPGGGSDISPSSGITGLLVLDNGSPATISSAVRASATTITLTCSAALTGPVTMRAGYGAYPDVSGWVVDNTALALPLQTTDADVSVSAGGGNVTVGLSGISASFAAGTLTASSSAGSTVALTGESATFVQATPSISVTVALTGIAATMAAGILSSSSGTVTITVRAGSWIRYKAV